MPDGIDPSSRAAADPLVGRVLSQRYHILAKLGEGAMAAVYLAEHTGVGTNIVLKVLLPELASRQEFVDRFLQEVRIASDIHHDNIIDIFYSGRSPEGLVFLAMEYVPGTNLGELLAHTGALPWERAQPILHQVADALAAAHHQGVIHRDIKPDNILIREQETPEGRSDFVKVVDFGISSLEGGLSMSKGIYGTPEYMAPEQAQAQAPDERDDVYAFGCLMYHVLTGGVPFTAPTLQQLLIKQIQIPPEPLRARRPDLSITDEVEAIVLRAMEKKRQDRWPTMAELAGAIAAIPARPPKPEPEPPPPVVEPAPAPAPAPRPSRRRLAVRMGLAVIVVGLFITAAALYHGPRPVPGRLEIATVPSDAIIYIEGRKFGARSPLLLEASPGRYTLKVSRDGYDPVQQGFEIRSREALRIPVTLPVSEATRVEFTSDPPGARLRLDGELLGTSQGEARTAHTVKRVRPGPHVVEMDDVAGHDPWTNEFEVVLGAHRRVHGALPLTPMAPSVTIEPSAPARVTSTRVPATAGAKAATSAGSSRRARPADSPSVKAVEPKPTAPPPAAPATAPRTNPRGITYLDLEKGAVVKPAADGGSR